ncbi:MAG: hypothetical protein N2654_07165 [Deltaproteobacteria bacterium]|nr:hypothetical protein [Deltaproteobacteria bacterium]
MFTVLPIPRQIDLRPSIPFIDEDRVLFSPGWFRSLIEEYITLMPPFEGVSKLFDIKKIGVAILEKEKRTVVLVGETHVTNSQYHAFLERCLVAALPGFVALEGPLFMPEDIPSDFFDLVKRDDTTRSQTLYTASLGIYSAIVYFSSLVVIELAHLFFKDYEDVLRNDHFILSRVLRPMLYSVRETLFRTLTNEEPLTDDDLSELMQEVDRSRKFLKSWLSLGEDKDNNSSWDVTPADQESSNFIAEPAKTIQELTKRLTDAILDECYRLGLDPVVLLENVILFLNHAVNLNRVSLATGFMLPVQNDEIIKPAFFLEGDLGAHLEADPEKQALQHAFNQVVISFDQIDSGTSGAAFGAVEHQKIIKQYFSKARQYLSFRDELIANNLNTLMDIPFDEIFSAPLDEQEHCFCTVLLGLAHVNGVLSNLINSGWKLIAQFSPSDTGVLSTVEYPERFEALEAEIASHARLQRIVCSWRAIKLSN